MLIFQLHQVSAEPNFPAGGGELRNIWTGEMRWWPFGTDSSDGAGATARGAIEVSPEDSLDPELRQYFRQVTSGAAELPTVTSPNGTVPLSPMAQQVMHKSDSRPKSLRQAAMDNCAEYEKALSTCLSQGGMLSRLSACYEQQGMLRKCVDMQQALLTVLGFSDTESLENRATIKGAADDFMLRYVPRLQITESMELEFGAALKQLRQK